MLLDILIPLLGVAADQLVKYWACVRLKPVETLPVVREVFHLTYCENRGAAFSLFSGKRWLLLLITAVLLAGILYAMKKQWVRGGLGRWGLRLILGGALGNLIDRLLRGYVDFVEQRSPDAVEEYRARIAARMTEILDGSELAQQRILQEAALYADKVNVTEEIVRLRSHLSQLDTMLQSPVAIGRKLDFLIQELNRETNTIGSKASDFEIAKTVVEMKAEIEKIREQIQNLE